MKKILIFLLFCAFNISANSQVEIPESNLLIEMVKARKIGVLSVQFQTPVMVNSGKDHKRVQVRLKVEALGGELTIFDPNKLSFVSDEFKARFSVAQALFASPIKTKGFGMLTDNDSENDIVMARYDPSVENTFRNYSQNGYKDIPISLNFGTNRKPRVHTIYFRPSTVDDKDAIDVYFVVPNEVKMGKFYFGETLISEIKVR